MGHGEVRVRTVRTSDVAILDRRFARLPSSVHRDRLARQEAGDAVYLVAWAGERLVGFVFLKWAGSGDAFLKERLDTARIPDLEDLLVAEDVRRRGVAGRIMETAENLVRDRGFDRIGVDVAVDNDPARALYAGRSYEDAGTGPYEVGDHGVREDGTPWSWSETVVYLVKRL